MTRAEAAHTRCVYLTPGEILGAYRILAVEFPSFNSYHRLYRVVTTCCGQEMMRSHKVLLEGRRQGYTLCQGCAQEAAVVRGFAVGEVVGPVTILAMDKPLWRRVRWSCCGAEAALATNRLHQLKHRAKEGAEQLCGECHRRRRRALKQPAQRLDLWRPAPATLPPDVLPAALAWPRPGVAA